MTYKSIWASTESLTKQRADKISKLHYKDLQNTRALCQSISNYSVAIIFSFDSTDVNSVRKTSKNLHVCRACPYLLELEGYHWGTRSASMVNSKSPQNICMNFAWAFLLFPEVHITNLEGMVNHFKISC